LLRGFVVSSFKVLFGEHVVDAERVVPSTPVYSMRLPSASAAPRSSLDHHSEGRFPGRNAARSSPIYSPTSASDKLYPAALAPSTDGHPQDEVNDNVASGHTTLIADAIGDGDRRDSPSLEGTIGGHGFPLGELLLGDSDDMLQSLPAQGSFLQDDPYEDVFESASPHPLENVIPDAQEASNALGS